jgi:catechol 2,3-dioxygenase-like lactoylglutathione lyase family enzyme
MAPGTTPSLHSTLAVCTFRYEMRATGLNHVSIHARDLDRSVRFYVEVFGMERIPTYNFAFPVQYLRLGDLQLHIFQRETEAPKYHHIGINVDEFEETYSRAHELGILERESFFSDIYELPDGSVQMYIRDPAGNLVEIDWPDVDTLDRSVLPELKPLSDSVPQTGDALRATLYLEKADL